MEPLSARIAAFNARVKSLPSYLEKKKIRTSATIPCEDFNYIEPCLGPGDENWCIIDPVVAGLIMDNSKHHDENLKLSPKPEYEHSSRPSAISSAGCNQEHLYRLATAYINTFSYFASRFPERVWPDLFERIEQLHTTLRDDRESLLNQQALVAYISRFVQNQKAPTIKKARSLKREKRLKNLADKMGPLINDAHYSAKDICSICHVHMSMYYNVKKRLQQGPFEDVPHQSSRLSKSYLGVREMDAVRELVDDPRRSCTVKEIASELKSRFGVDVNPSTLLYHMHKTLNLTYKKNSYKPREYFSEVEAHERKKVSLEILELLEKGFEMVSIDECGIDLFTRRERSFSKKGKKPYRFGLAASQRINVVMAISRSGVLCYSMRLGSFESLSFSDFMIGLAKEIFLRQPSEGPGIFVFMDNVKFHHSRIVQELLSILGIKVVFNAVRFSQLNPIEEAFGLIKKKIKKAEFSNEYFERNIIIE